jgi:membrane protein implicated in regulation of membrane protease activity
LFSHVLKYQTASIPNDSHWWAFIFCIGLAIIVGSIFHGSELINRNIFLSGFMLGSCAMFGTKWLSPGKPTRIQIIAIVASIVLEIILMSLLPSFVDGPSTNLHRHIA